MLAPEQSLGYVLFVANLLQKETLDLQLETWWNDYRGMFSVDQERAKICAEMVKEFLRKTELPPEKQDSFLTLLDRLYSLAREENQ